VTASGLVRSARGLALGVFCAQFAMIDLLLRGRRAAAIASVGGAIAAFQSVCAWGALAGLAGRSARARAAVGVLAGAVLAVQALFFRRFAQWIDAQVIRSALASIHDVAPAFRAEVPGLLAAIGVGAGIEIVLLWASGAGRARGAGAARGGRTGRAGRVARWDVIAPAALFAALLPVGSLGAGAPDGRLAAGLVAPAVSHARTEAGASVRLPPLASRAEAPPNVVLIVTESVRADEYCAAPLPSCAVAPRVNATLPERIGMPEMRSLASYTAVSMSVLVTGREQDVRREELFGAPTVFDAIKAMDTAGAAPFTAYWSSHYFPVFHWEDPRRGVDSYVTRETLFAPDDDGEDGDARLARYAIDRLPGLPSPFFVLLHFHDTHLLYSFDEKNAPFQPWTREVEWSKMAALRNAYRNAIHYQDGAIADVLAALKSDPRWARTVVMFTSDHGESFGEHGQIHHGQDLLDEQIHVPAWVAAGAEALSHERAQALRENAGAFVTHLDVAPTILDLFGVLDSYGLAPHVRRMAGRSLVRPIRAAAPIVAMTNCTEAFPCPWSTWGVMRQDRKLEAQAWDFGWNCHALGGGAEAPLPLDDAGCQALLAESRRRFDKLPNGAPNRGP
jgi:hypothetical protein